MQRRLAVLLIAISTLALELVLVSQDYGTATVLVVLAALLVFTVAMRWRRCALGLGLVYALLAMATTIWLKPNLLCWYNKTL